MRFVHLPLSPIHLFPHQTLKLTAVYVVCVSQIYFRDVFWKKMAEENKSMISIEVLVEFETQPDWAYVDIQWVSNVYLSG